MAHGFSDMDGLRIAMEMEKRGVELYRRAARVSKQPEVVALLNRLAQDEVTHGGEFAALYERHRQDNDAQYDGETAAYLSAVAADVVFPEGLIDMARETGLNDAAGILRYAIQAEKDAVLFYEEMAARTRDEEERAVFAQILAQEKRHMMELMRMLMEEAP